MKGIISFFIFILVLCNSSATNSEDDYSEYNANIYEKYVKMDKQLRELAEQGVKRLLPYLLQSSEHVNISASCSKNLFQLITGFRKLTNWSFNFLDAMGKLQSGVQTGNLQMFGEYDQCIETVVMKREKIDFQGQFCLIGLAPLLPKVKKIPSMYGKLEGLVNATRNTSDIMKQIVSRAHFFYDLKIHIGICVPTGCSKHDISEILNYTLGEYSNASVDLCLKNGDIYFWTKKRIIIISFFVLLGIAVIVSTCLDNTLETWKKENLALKYRILQCFSLTRNFPKLLNTDVSSKSITCLNGVRVLTISWIALGHEYFLHALTFHANHILNVEKMMPRFFAQIVLNTFLAVDIFFFIGGFVNCYSRMLIKQEGKSQPGSFTIILHRLYRIYPAFIISLLLMYILNIPQPFTYQHQVNYSEMCDRYWWQNFLFINNFFDPLDLCMPTTWFLAVDMQMFLVSLVTIPVLLRKPKAGIILHVGIILLSNVCSMSWWLLDDLPPTNMDYTKMEKSVAERRMHIYNMPVIHIGSYFIGILLGYVIATVKEIKISKVMQIFGWIVSSVLFTSILFITMRWTSGTSYTRLESSFYGAWSCTLFVLGFSWLILCCATGHARLFNYILSLKLWIPLSRITYMIYLVSVVIQGYQFSQTRFPMDFSPMPIVWNYFANLSISILMSFGLVLIAESPVLAMEKLLFRRDHMKTKLPHQLTTNNIRENGVQENGKFSTTHL